VIYVSINKLYFKFPEVQEHWNLSNIWPGKWNRKQFGEKIRNRKNANKTFLLNNFCLGPTITNSTACVLGGRRGGGSLYWKSQVKLAKSDSVTKHFAGGRYFTVLRCCRAWNTQTRHGVHGHFYLCRVTLKILQEVKPDDYLTTLVGLWREIILTVPCFSPAAPSQDNSRDTIPLDWSTEAKN
jgi:hypothetical protein